MSENEKALMKQLERMLGHVPVGTLDLVRVLAHPDVIDLTRKVLDDKDERLLEALFGRKE